MLLWLYVCVICMWVLAHEFLSAHMEKQLLRVNFLLPLWVLSIEPNHWFLTESCLPSSWFFYLYGHLALEFHRGYIESGDFFESCRHLHNINSAVHTHGEIIHLLASSLISFFFQWFKFFIVDIFYISLPYLFKGIFEPVMNGIASIVYFLNIFAIIIMEDCWFCMLIFYTTTQF